MTKDQAEMFRMELSGYVVEVKLGLPLKQRYFHHGNWVTEDVLLARLRWTRHCGLDDAANVPAPPVDWQRPSIAELRDKAMAIIRRDFPSPTLPGGRRRGDIGGMRRERSQSSRRED